MVQHLVLTVRLHDSRYHGMPSDEWPPAPARVFQALVAGVARGSELDARFAEAFGWLEGLAAPVIAAPRARLGSLVNLFVPNNDADAEGGAMRTSKAVRPHLIEGDAAFLYAWPLSDGLGRSDDVIAAAEKIYQLGRGVDMAWGAGELLSDEALADRLARHRGPVHHPADRGSERALPCPAPGSLASLIRRHRAARLRAEGTGRAARLLFVNAPKPRFAAVSYRPAEEMLLFELREQSREERPWPWPMHRVATLVERVRNAAAERLREALPSSRDSIDRTLGPAAESDETLEDVRVRVVPLPSIGHEHADRAVRRILLDVPDACPLSTADLAWAFAGLETADPTTGEVDAFVLTRTSERDMLDRHYRRSARRFRSVTPLALPVTATRRRIEPSRQREEAKNATERATENAAAIAAVRLALREAGIRARLIGARVQREPFETRGVRAERFAPGSAFEKERLWHVDLELDALVEGPLVLGDGRLVGLGVMAPVDPRCVLAFRVDGAERLDACAVARAMRRAVMSRVQREIGNAPLGRYFSGHETDRSPARGSTASHLAFHVPDDTTLLVLGPDVLDGHIPSAHELEQFRILERALEGMNELRVPRHPILRLTHIPTDDAPYLATAREWESVHPYEVNQHRRASSAATALALDVIESCARRNLPRPEVDVREVFAVRGRGLRGRVHLRFATAVTGPIALGRSRYLGGGLFTCSARVTEDARRAMGA